MKAVIAVGALVLAGALISGQQPPVQQGIFETNTPRPTVDCTVTACASVAGTVTAREDAAVPQAVSIEIVPSPVYPTPVFVPTATMTPRPGVVAVWTCYQFDDGTMTCAGR